MSIKMSRETMFFAYRGAYSDPNHPENDLVHDWSKEWTDENIQQGVCMGGG